MLRKIPQQPETNLRVFAVFTREAPANTGNYGGGAPFAPEAQARRLVETISNIDQPEVLMLRRKNRTAVIAVIALASLHIPVSSAATKPHSAGRVTATVANTILNGKGAPIASKGIDGDFYIDTRSLSIYGPKAKGKWPVAQSLQGASGANGKNGADGKATTSASTSTTPGAAGAAGVAGAAGTMGVAGTTGPAGAIGPAGAVGATGPAGASGSSRVKISTIGSFSINSATPYSSNTSSTFQTLTAGTSHRITIVMYGSGTNAADEPFGIELIGTNSPSINQTFMVSEHNTVTGVGSKSNRYTIILEGTVVVGASDSGLTVKIVDGYVATDGSPITFVGHVYDTEVGSVN